MNNIFDELINIVGILITRGYKIETYTLLDIKHERKDREIILISNDKFKLYYYENKLHLETTYSNTKVDDDFIEEATFLNALLKDFNS